ncbi:hypothetical protein QFC20_006143 [Naganishia adeliensis]|uniref:Uncharacterized protein n=1 Tax=Naganishia adeliensis TaxID=92952 RepID=A0ACC2VE48_9TREE|nr:hypothetical protein QFC20_006143 [Naganishia adeliensis]
MPPPPAHVFRSHSYPVHCSAFSTDNHLLHAGDEEGWVTITDLQAKRVVAHWKAHEAGVLGVADWQGGIVSHGRDNIIHFHAPLDLSSTPSQPTLSPKATPSSSKAVATTNGYRNLLSPPHIIRSLPVNSLNFCGFHLIPIPTGYEPDIPVVEGLGTDKLDGSGKGEDEPGKLVQDRFMRRWNAAQGLLAVPNLTDSETIDIYHVPSFGRLHAAVSSRAKAPAQAQREGKPRTGLVMSTHLYFTTTETPSAKATPLTGHPAIANGIDQPSTLEPTESTQSPVLRLVAAFEDGRVEHWECRDWSKRTDPRMRGASESSTELSGWHNLWTQKGHNEAIMAMAVSPTLDYAYTVSADHQVVKYDLQQSASVPGDVQPSPARYPTKQIGNAAVAVSPDGRVVAVGGWDGRKSAEQADTSDEASVIDVVQEDEGNSSSDDDHDSARRGGKEDVMRWMVTGGKDRRVALWQLKDFSRR